MNQEQTKSYIEMMDSIYLKKKLKMTAQQEKKIAEVYSKSLQDVIKKLKTSKSGSIAESYYKNMAKSLYSELYKLQEETINSTAYLAMKMNKEAMEEIGWQAGVTGQFQKMFTNVPSETLQNLIAGGIYEDGKGLSARIWNHAQGASEYVQGVVDAGLANGQSAKDMAKALSKYVDPTKATTLKSKAAIEGLGSAYKNIEYNSLRLARTSISHSFTLGQKLAAKKNPFQDGFIWHSVFSHGRTCQECMDRDGTYYSTKDLPYDHPNGMCWNEPAYEHDLEHYADRIANWVDTGDDILLEKWYNKEYLGMSTKEAKEAAKASVKAIKQGKAGGANLTPRQSDFRRRARDYRRIQQHEVTDWDKGHYDKWKKSLERDEYDAVVEYTGSDYHWMNKHLRGIDTTTRDYRLKLIDDCKKALDKSIVPDDVVVFRGSDKVMLNSTGIPKEQMVKIIDNELHRLEGMVISDQGFISTSVLGDTAFSGNLLLEIKVPAGTKGAYVRSMSNFSRENELILQAGTKFQIEKAEKVGYDTLKLFVEVME